MAPLKAHVFVLSVLLVPPICTAGRALQFWPSEQVFNNILSTPLARAIAAILYCLAVWKIVWPQYFGPFANLTWAPGDIFGLGHQLSLISFPLGPKFVNELNTASANNGLLQYTGIFCIERGVALCSEEAIMEALIHKSNDFCKPLYIRDFLHRIAGNGLLIVKEGREHTAQRKLVWPSFQGHHLRNLVPLFWTKSIDMTDTIESELASNPRGVGEDVLDFHSLASRATLDIIGVAGFGLDFETLHNSDDEIASNFHALFNPEDFRISSVFLAHVVLGRWLAPKAPLPGNHHIDVCGARLRNLCETFLRDKRLQLKGRSVDADKSILSNLVRHGNLSDRDIVDQLLTFLAAGHETTASSLLWASYELAKRPAIQVRLRTEVRDTLGTSVDRSSMDVDTLEGMAYLDAFCTEVLRFWPVLMYIPRNASRDTVLCGTRIPRGTRLHVPVMGVNRSRPLWGPDAHEFRPERWLGTGDQQDRARRERAALLTFGHGPRSCIGQGFARLELKCLVAALIARYELSPEDAAMAEPTPTGTITVKPGRSLKLHFKSLK